MKRVPALNRQRVALLLLPFWLCLAYATSVEAQPTVTKTWSLETDVNLNTLVDAGDTIKYTVQIGAATDVVFADPIPDVNTQLVVGSVTCADGSPCLVITGNTAGDTQVGVQVG
ncbi:MAG: hypothetical protein H6Q33_3412, partial [Deltaproteobacteria bacterium]|nr:hypothetical protein [Deltaproteobacteria bacterium]